MNLYSREVGEPAKSKYPCTNILTKKLKTFGSQYSLIYIVSIACRARASQLRTHFKKMREVGRAVRGMNLKSAQKYLENVLEFKQAVPFRRFTGGCGRTAQAKAFKAPGSQAGWPVKSVKLMLDLLRHVENNGEVKGLDTDNLKITHMQVNQAPKMRRRTYRAHGRINAYMSSPCHVELICTEVSDTVKKTKSVGTQLKLSRKSQAKLRMQGRLPEGGGVGADGDDDDDDMPALEE